MRGFTPRISQRLAAMSTGPEFGTNTGRQGIFDINDPSQERLARDRASQLEAQWGNRLQPGFTGSTGLAKNDSRGWSNMLNAQTEYQNITRGLAGKSPLTVEYGGVESVNTPGEESSARLDRMGLEQAAGSLGGIMRVTQNPRPRPRQRRER
jgi:hypothetical protein